MAYLVPDHIRKKFIDSWAIHVLLTFLTDKGCLLKDKSISSSSQDLLTIDNSQILTTAKPLSDDGELDLTFDEWHQAWRCLLDLIKLHLPDKFLLWEVHYSFILNNDNWAELWPLYLAYDTKICKRATQLPIDPLKFSIGIWNNLETRFNAKRVLFIVQADLKSHQILLTHLESLTETTTAHLLFVPITNNTRKLHAVSSVVIILKITPPAIVLFQPTPAVFLATYLKTAPQANDKANQGSPTALPGMVFLVVHNLPAYEASTGVLSAVPSHTMLNNVPTLHNLFIINTLLIPKQWHIMLTSTNLFNRFHDVPTGLHFGFDMGVNSPLPLLTPHLIIIPPFPILHMSCPIFTMSSFNVIIFAPSLTHA
jgi:hypothetical protein